MGLASSHDGRTLAGVDSYENVTLFEFETLRVLCWICFETRMLPRCLAFTANSLRFVEVRGDQFRVWEPTVLLRSDAVVEGGGGDGVYGLIGVEEIEYKVVGKAAPDITAIACCRDSGVVFCGTDDGTVHVYDIAGRELRSQVLFVQTAGCAVHLFHLDESASVLVCGDHARVTARKLTRRPSRQRNV